MSLYLFEIKEQGVNVNRFYDILSFNYAPVKCNTEKLIIKLIDNEVHILDKYYNLKYKGNYNQNLTQYKPYGETKIYFDMEPSLNFIGGTLILEKNRATFVHNGSSLKFLAAYRGSVTRI